MPEASLVIIFVTSLLVGFSGALIPGPLFTLNISESIRKGYKVGPTLVAGHALAEITLLIALGAGLNQLINNKYVIAAIGLLGGLFLMWMASGIMRSSFKARVIAVEDAPRGSTYSSLVVAGILTSVFNPGWIVWWATVGSAYMLWSLKAGIVGVASFFSGHILSDAVWYISTSALAASGRRIMSIRIYRSILFACGIFLVFLGGYFIYGSIKGWLSLF